ncbi:MAG: hypothetical protein NTX53_05705 [candidate division WOR-3 bacterium]|nr:hypothetical protein [candidate division WOR-3 bacterium]
MNDEYEAPQAIHTERSGPSIRGLYTRQHADAPNVGYRVNEFEGICVTGKSATDGCHMGI